MINRIRVGKIPIIENFLKFKQFYRRGHNVQNAKQNVPNPNSSAFNSINNIPGTKKDRFHELAPYIMIKTLATRMMHTGCKGSNYSAENHSQTNYPVRKTCCNLWYALLHLYFYCGL